VAAAIQELDVVVHASTSPEPFGQVVVEAMASGRPVVATDGGGIRETVVHGVTGLLVPLNQPVGMANAIKQLLRDPEKARAMGRAGAERVRANFTVDHTARKVEQIYELLFASRRKRTRGRLKSLAQTVDGSAL
jgi:glycosyltransferase involved in cell wall biosynthesis